MEDEKTKGEEQESKVKEHFTLFDQRLAASKSFRLPDSSYVDAHECFSFAS